MHLRFNVADPSDQTTFWGGGGGGCGWLSDTRVVPLHILFLDPPLLVEEIESLDFPKPFHTYCVGSPREESLVIFFLLPSIRTEIFGHREASGDPLLSKSFPSISPHLVIHKSGITTS